MHAKNRVKHTGLVSFRQWSELIVYLDTNPGRAETHSYSDEEVGVESCSRRGDERQDTGDKDTRTKDVLSSVFTRQNPAEYLSGHVTVEVRTKDSALELSRPFKLTLKSTTEDFNINPGRFQEHYFQLMKPPN